MELRCGAVDSVTRWRLDNGKWTATRSSIISAASAAPPRPAPTASQSTDTHQPIMVENGLAKMGRMSLLTFCHGLSLQYPGMFSYAAEAAETKCNCVSMWIVSKIIVSRLVCELLRIRYMDEILYNAITG